jgi:hypothetical protein
MMKKSTLCLVVWLGWGVQGIRSAEPLGAVPPDVAWQQAAVFDASKSGQLSGASQAHGPHVPEPLVFDLVRPLGARRGELEVNTLAIMPLTSSRSGSVRAGDELGLVPLSEDRAEIEWAPEIEFALWDGFAVEFEFPFEGSRLEELKLGMQFTFGTAFDDRFIHGFQGLAERALQSTTTSWTGLYLAAMRFSPRWSALGMWGLSYEAGAGVDEIGGDRTQALQNLSVFYNLTDEVHLGLETNYAVSTAGDQTLLLMPQLQLAMGQHLSLQLGAGVGFSASETLPQAALRLIATF